MTTSKAIKELLTKVENIIFSDYMADENNYNNQAIDIDSQP